MAFLARLSRTIPLIVVMGLLAGVIYLVLKIRTSPNRAKEVLIKVCLWLYGIQTVLFLLLMLYALFENNVAVAELWAAFALVTFVAVVIALVCRWRFKKNHPNYKSEVTDPRAKVVPNRPWPFNNFKFPWEK